MNFQTLHKQRKFILVAAVVGIIAVFLPWKTISAGILGMGMSEGISGFRGAGIVAFLAFLGAGIVPLFGDQTKALDSSSWLITLLAGVIALICVLINVFTTMGSGMGFVEMGVGIGCWVALVASLGVAAFSWMFRRPGETLNAGFESLKKNISSATTTPTSTGAAPVSTAPTVTTPPSTPVAAASDNKIAELEKLVQMKNAGHITEEEFRQMKSRLL